MDAVVSSQSQSIQLWFTPAELAARWRISISAVNHNKCNVDNLPRHRFGRGVRFHINDIEKTERAIIMRGGRKFARRKKYVDDGTGSD